MIGGMSAVTLLAAGLPLALAVPGIGIAITGLIILVPRWFSALSVTFALYSVFVIYITA